MPPGGRRAPRTLPRCSTGAEPDCAGSARRSREQPRRPRDERRVVVVAERWDARPLRVVRLRVRQARRRGDDPVHHRHACDEHGGAPRPRRLSGRKGPRDGHVGNHVVHGEFLAPGRTADARHLRRALGAPARSIGCRGTRPSCIWMREVATRCRGVASHRNEKVALFDPPTADAKTWLCRRERRPGSCRWRSRSASDRCAWR